MPYNFKFSVDNPNSRDNGQRFSCELESQQCVGTTKAGSQCSRSVVLGINLCWSHLQSEKHLKIKESTVPGAGKGLFAWAPSQSDDWVFKKGDIICEYLGERMTKAKSTQRYGRDATAPYTVRIPHTHTDIDSSCVRGYASFTNAGNNYNSPVFPSNVAWSVVAKTRTKPAIIRFKAHRNIAHGEELLVHYGDEYIIAEPGVVYSTKYSRPSRRKSR
jgi:hypothetical protein